jgi:beta-lactam-binding protein with PASTA domain
VKKKFSRRVKKGRVLAQSPKAGRRLAKNAKVDLVVSRGRRHR